MKARFLKGVIDKLPHMVFVKQGRWFLITIGLIKLERRSLSFDKVVELL
jgi:hypothetical protein